MTAPAPVPHPLAPQQRGLWFVQQLRPSAEYNLQIAMRLHGPLDTGSLANALHLVVLRHEPLRTRIVADDAGVPRQHVTPAPPLDLTVEQAPPGCDPAAHERAVMAADVSRPFDLATELPMRVRLVELAPRWHLLVVTFNHLAMDGVSLGIVLCELTSAYAALTAREPVRLPPLDVGFTDHARWLAERGTDPAGLEYWRRELDGVGQLTLPADRAGHGVGAPITTLRLPVAPETVRGLAGLARAAGSSLF